MLICAASWAASQPPPTAATTLEVIHAIEDPQQREQLVKELNVLAQQQSNPPAGSSATASSAAPQNHTVLSLENLSKSISGVHLGAAALIKEFRIAKGVIKNYVSQLKDPEKRDIIAIMLLKCLIVVGLGYGAFYLSTRLLSRVFQRISNATPQHFAVKIFNVLGWFFLSLLPIALFAVVAYFCLVFLHIGEPVQSVLLAWITAFIIVKLLLNFYHFLLRLTESFPHFFPSDPNTKKFLQDWVNTLTAVIVYGYFILQVTLLMGVSPDTYKTLLNLLGLIIVLLLVIFILRSPLQIIKLFSNSHRRIKKVMTLERISRIESLWRAVAIVYLFLLYVVWVIQASHFFWFVLRSTLLSLILLFLVIKLANFLHRFLTREVKLSHQLTSRLPGLEQRFRNYRRILDVVLRAFIYILAGVIIFKIWSGNQLVWITDALRALIFIKIISISCIVLLAILIWEFSNSLLEVTLTKKGEDLTIPSGRTHTLLTVGRKTISITLSIIAFLMILSELNVNIAPLLAGAGVLGLAISFGGQKLVQDLITGFFMLLENQIAVGDVVNIGDKSGLVEAISIRTVRLRDAGGPVHIIPYSSIVTVTNLTKEFSCYPLEIGVAYRENIDAVIVVIQQLGDELQQDPVYGPLILERLEVLGLDKFADSAIIIKARIKTKPGMQWRVGREYNRRMKQRFDELDIQIPFPHTVVFFGENTSLPTT
jgi:moderate conductance mechanosensitive channel